MSNSSIWLIGRTLSGATTPGQSGPGRDANEGVLRIPQSPSTTGASSSDCLVSYPGHSLWWGAYPFVEMQSAYSTAPADRAKPAENDIHVPSAVKRTQTTRLKSAWMKWNVQIAVKTIQLTHDLATFIKSRKKYLGWNTRKTSVLQKLGK